MADFTQIIQEINDDINTNGVGAITGAKLNEVLRDMIAAVNAAKTDILPDGALYGGYVGPQDPPTYGNDYRYYYLAEETGDYIYFNHWYVDSNVSMFYYDIDSEVWRQKLLWVKNDILDGLLSYKAGKPVSSTQGHIPNLDQYGDLQDSGIDIDDVATTADLSGKQDVITDLATIRSGASAGATAYQKPSGGIPKTDLASGVQTSLGKADTAFQKPSGGIPASDLAAAVQTSLGKADTALQSYTETDPVFSASPAAGITSGDIADWDDKAEPIEIVDASTPPMTMQPDKVYQYGTLSGDTTFPLLLFINDGKAHIHCWTFATPSTAPTITWPVAITAWAGGSAPTINASKSYEVSVMDGLATIIEA